MAKFRIFGKIDVEVEANTEEEALDQFNLYVNEIVASRVCVELIEEE